MVNWLGVIAYIVILLAVFGLLYMMYLIIRLSSEESEDSGRYSQLKEMVLTLFGTPAHLRDSAPSSTDEETAVSSERALPFTESCPACGEQVTEKNASCPSCGLRLL